MFFIRSHMTRRSPKQSKMDDHAFPVRIRVLIPEGGIYSLGTQNDVWRWLHRQFGLGNVAVTPHRAWLGDAMAIHFRRIEHAVAFQERFPMLALADDTMSDLYSSPYVRAGPKKPVA